MVEKHRDYAMLRMRCPEGHVLGRVYMDRDEKWIPEAGTSLFWANGKLRARCTKCVSAGKPPRDLQGSASKIVNRLKELRANPTRGTDDYVMGG